MKSNLCGVEASIFLSSVPNHVEMCENEEVRMNYITLNSQMHADVVPSRINESSSKLKSL